MKDAQYKDLPLRTRRQIELLKDYYDVDFENKLITIELYYEKASDILDLNLSTPKKPHISSEVLVNIKEIIKTIPSIFNVNLVLNIDDFESYDGNLINKSLADKLELSTYSVTKSKNKEFIQAIGLMIISLVILFFRQIGIDKQILDSSLMGNLYSEALDICAWVFLWEGVSIIFLHNSDLKEVTDTFCYRISNYILNDCKLNKCFQLSSDNMKKDWIHTNKYQKASRVILLVSGAGLFTEGILRVGDVILNFTNSIPIPSNELLMRIISFVIYIVSSVFLICGGICALSQFRDNGPLRNKFNFFSYSFLILTGVFIVLTVTNSIFITSSYNTVLEALRTVLIGLFAVGFFVSKKLFKMKPLPLHKNKNDKEKH